MSDARRSLRRMAGRLGAALLLLTVIAAGVAAVAWRDTFRARWIAPALLDDLAVPGSLDFAEGNPAVEAGLERLGGLDPVAVSAVLRAEMESGDVSRAALATLLLLTLQDEPWATEPDAGTRARAAEVLVGALALDDPSLVGIARGHLAMDLVPEALVPLVRLARRERGLLRPHALELLADFLRELPRPGTTDPEERAFSIERAVEERRAQVVAEVIELLDDPDPALDQPLVEVLVAFGRPMIDRLEPTVRGAPAPARRRAAHAYSSLAVSHEPRIAALRRLADAADGRDDELLDAFAPALRGGFVDPVPTIVPSSDEELARVLALLDRPAPLRRAAAITLFAIALDRGIAEPTRARLVDRLVVLVEDPDASIRLDVARELRRFAAWDAHGVRIVPACIARLDRETDPDVADWLVRTLIDHAAREQKGRVVDAIVEAARGSEALRHRFAALRDDPRPVAREIAERIEAEDPGDE